jgi:hypothetical protein
VRCLTKRSRRRPVIATHARVPSLAKPRSARLSANVRHQSLKLRVFAWVVLLVGLALLFIGITGYLRGPSLAQFMRAASREFRGVDSDWCRWLTHWRAWALGIACAGFALAVSGAALAFQRRWGFLLMAAVLTAVAGVPWVLQALRLTRYTYERAETPGTLATLALAFLAIVAFLRTRGLRPMPNDELERPQRG